ncbi:sugar ABC transporter ATP-binding protein [Desulfosporosinus sp. Sb-LF]|uniref:sugar ABC transporter ATP-binding protein n=1 Tax=Desulfosporosinus sp. Sb-LF TaxID=2560027 RepID=UPI00107FC051|nr:sugar ABC transporter ATP-binding protein [Desulfosporosinus sp. Sb-LF]TGE31692.1 sugar ABC transporter ATP-binding protein [Desulfosporosinus sp. Sb-LF]
MGENKLILEMRGISKGFSGVQALKKVNLSVESGEVHCLIGANGAGKSTLMKVLSGVYSMDEGEILFDQKLATIIDPISSTKMGISVIYQELSLLPNLSVAENIFIGKYPRKYRYLLDWAELTKKARALIDSLGIKIDVMEPISNLSIGHRQIVELAKALASNAKLIVMDEPSATLSSEEFETLVRVIQELKNKGISIIYISHRLEELFRVGDKVTVLRDGQYVATKQLNEITQDQLVELIIGHPLSKEKKPKLSVSYTEELVSLKDIHTNKLNAINLSLYKGEVLGLYGLVGSGRTEILRAIYGADPLQKGELYINGGKVKFRSPAEAMKKGIALVPESRKTQGLLLNLSVWENAVVPSLKKYTRFGFLKYPTMFKHVNEQVEQLKVVTPSIRASVKNLSGGNQQKVVIAKWLLKNSNILLFDEPTQGIDIGAKEEVYKIIKNLSDKGFGVIVASSELAELVQLCDRMVVMFNGNIAGEFQQEEFKDDAILHCAVTGG